MKKQIFYLNPTKPELSDWDVIKWTYRINGEIIYSTAFKELIGYNLFAN